MTDHPSREPRNQSRADLDLFARTAAFFEEGPDPTIEKLESFAKYVPRQTLAKFLARYEIFKRILHVNGSIVECGVLRGGGTFTFAKLSAIFEPANHTRRVIGFDTFAGFASVHERDRPGTFSDLRPGGLAADSLDDLQRGAEIFDLNRPIGHIPKIELVPGDLTETAPRYLLDHPHLVVALLYLDVDLYEPTKVALEQFVPRMPKGAVIAFDELNAEIFPGETTAVDEVLGLRNLRIERFPFDSYVSFAVLD
jgi:hypothetical protein